MKAQARLLNDTFIARLRLLYIKYKNPNATFTTIDTRTTKVTGDYLTVHKIVDKFYAPTDKNFDADWYIVMVKDKSK